MSGDGMFARLREKFKRPEEFEPDLGWVLQDSRSQWMAENVSGVTKPDPALVVKSLRRSFGGLVAVDVDHLEIQRGVITALIGPNGAGKTTFFNLLTGFDRPDSGSVLFDGRDIGGLRSHERARRGMVRTFQLTKALTKLSVLENMKLGAKNQVGEGFLRSLAPPLWRAQERPSRSGPWSCWRDSRLPTWPTSTREPCRAASGSCSRWPGH